MNAGVVPCHECQVLFAKLLVSTFLHRAHTKFFLVRRMRSLNHVGLRESACPILQLKQLAIYYDKLMAEI
ncbi:hypothetical protein CCR91_09090 [Thiorhodovibrio winogradskyi]|nr:hypothetical protein [Thiorhodovibrio winogradskyi]